METQSMIDDSLNRSRNNSYPTSNTLSINSILPASSSVSSSTNSINSIKEDPKEPKLSTSSESSTSSTTSSASSSSCSFVSASIKTNYKQQKENYLTEKKRITNDIITVMKDERIIVLADWLKVRSSLKNWIKLYVILKPGIMLLFKSDKMKSGHWVGTIILNSCQLLERPSKKHGFCFKLFHPLERSIWASKGPSGETNINVPYILLPTFYLIFRAPSEKVGNIWMEAIELALKTSNLPKRLTNSTTSSNLNESFRSTKSASSSQKQINPNSSKRDLNDTSFTLQNSVNSQVETDIENKHFKEICDKDEAQLSDSDNGKNSSDEACSLNSSINNDNIDEDYFYNENVNCTTISSNGANANDIQNGVIDNLVDQTLNRSNSEDSRSSKETNYVQGPKEEFGELGNKGQTEEVAEENRSLIFHLVKQVRPGMDLSKVTLPTFILEPRSFLEKLSDYYYHSDILTESINNDDPFERMKSVVKFYLSGFYKKPKGLKKP
ncbi:unnamed protein product, partial [Brachionus calyciflorus]